MRIFSFSVLLSGDRWFAKGDQFVPVNLQTWSMERPRILLIQFGFILCNVSIQNSVAYDNERLGCLRMATATLQQADYVLQRRCQACFELCFGDSP